MPYIRPPFFVRKIFNPIAVATGIGSSGALSVRGRRTGRPQRIPVIPVEHRGARYLVSTRGESEWVRNVRAAGGEIELKTKSGTERLRAVEVPAAERPPIIEAYREKAGATVNAYWKALPDAADHPTFRLEPRA